MACFREGTAQTAWKPVYELLVHALRDAQQSVHANALQVLLLLRSGRGCCIFYFLHFLLPVILQHTWHCLHHPVILHLAVLLCGFIDPPVKNTYYFVLLGVVFFLSHLALA